MWNGTTGTTGARPFLSEVLRVRGEAGFLGAVTGVLALAALALGFLHLGMPAEPVLYFAGGLS